MARILVTGAKGMLGSKAVAILGNKHTIIPCDIDEFDITNANATRAFITEAKPDYILHCAAYTAVDNAEDDRERCHAINVEGTANVATVADEVDATIFYYSTDYVFDGKKDAPYLEDDPVDPINYYGKTKLEGERTVKDLARKYFIIRITWLFGENGKNFPATMLRLAKERDSLSVVSDQLGSPTYTEDVVRQTERLFDCDDYGIVHASAEGVCSWYDVAVATLREAGIEIPVNEVTSDAFPTKARRPAYSYLENARLKELGQNVMPPWEDGIHRYVRKMI